MDSALDLQHRGQKGFDMATLAALGQALVNQSTECRRCKGIGGIVTLAALTQGRNMVDRFGRRNTTVMTYCAITRINTLVAVEHTAKSCVVRVTDRAILLEAGNMSERQAETDVTVMAQCAIPGIDTDVVEWRRHERIGVMADTAVFHCRQVIDALAETDDIVMTAGTAHRVQVTGIVVKETARKRARRMANTTVLGRRQMLYRLAGGSVLAAIMA